MKKFKILFAAVLMMCSTAAFADDFDWSKCWCNYGAGLKDGDSTLVIGGGVPLDFFAYLRGGWAIPEVMVDYQKMVKLGELPFAFGGYASYQSYGVKGDGYKWANHYLRAGVEAAYHVMLPPEKLDVYVVTRAGLSMEFYNDVVNGKVADKHAYPYVHFGEAIGGSWYFSDKMAVNAEIGYPLQKVGILFKF